MHIIDRLKRVLSILLIGVVLSVDLGNMIQTPVYAEDNPEQLNDSTGEFQLTNQILMDQFGVSEAFINEQIDAGFNLHNIYSALWLAQTENLTYKEAIERLFPQEVNNSQTVTFDVYGDDASVTSNVYNNLSSMKLAADFSGISVYPVDKSLSTVTTQVYGEDKPGDSSATDAVSAKLSAADPLPMEEAPVFDKTRINEAPYSIGSNNESVSSLSGSLSLNQTDLSLPGRHGLSFDLTRRYDSSDAQFYDEDFGSSIINYDITKYYVQFTAIIKAILPKYNLNFKEDMWVEEDYNGDGIVDYRTMILDSKSYVYGTYESSVDLAKAQSILAKRGVRYSEETSKKTAVDSRTSSVNSFPSSIFYSKDGYSGYLYKDGLNSIGDYTPESSKTATSTCHHYIAGKYNSKGQWQVTDLGEDCPSYVSYNQGGYKGTLYLKSTVTEKSCPSAGGTPNYVCTKHFVANYSGTVTKPAVDTRKYIQTYTGTVEKHSWNNSQDYRWRYAYGISSQWVDTFYEEERGTGTPIQVTTEELFDTIEDATTYKKWVSRNANLLLQTGNDYNLYIAAKPNPSIETMTIPGSYITYYNKTVPKAEEQMYPIGKGWTWDLPFIEKKDGKRYLHLAGGGTYEVDGTKLKGYDWEGLSLTADSSVTVNGEKSAHVLSSVDGLRKQYFTSDGRLIQISDAYNNTIQFLYQQNASYGRKLLSQIKDAIGNTIQITYTTTSVKLTKGFQTVTYSKQVTNGNELLGSVTDVAGRKTTYSYNLAPAKFNLMASNPERAISNPYALLTQVQHPTGAVSNYQYESNPIRRYIGKEAVHDAYRISSRLDRIFYSNGTSEDYNHRTFYYNNTDYASTYDQDVTFSTTVDNGLTQMINTYKKDYIDEKTATQFYLDRTVEKGGNLEKTTAYAYAKKVGSNTYPVSQPTTITMSDNVTSDILSTTIQYDDYGNPVQTTDAKGATTNYTYDAKHLLKSVTEPVNSSTSTYTEYQRNAQGEVTQITVRQNNASGAVLQQVDYPSFDAYGNFTSQRVWNGSKATTTHLEYSGSLGSAFPTKQSVTVTDADGQTSTIVTQAEYDPMTGLMTAYIDGKNYRTRYQYDNLGRILQVTYPDNTMFTANYDDLLNTLVTTNEIGSQSKISWNALGWKLDEGIINSVGYQKLKTYGYDSFGRMKWEADALGNQTDYQYDSWSRPTLTTYADSTTSKTDYNDALRQVVSIDGEGIVKTAFFDKWGQLYQQTEQTSLSGSPTVLQKSEFDLISGKLLTLTDANNQITQYTYNAMGDLLSVVNPLGEWTSYTYDSLGNLLQITHPDGATQKKTYDELGRIIQQTDTAGLSSKIYYDANDNIIRTVDRNGTVATLNYDTLDRLTSRDDGQETLQYTYDPAGKRTTMTDNTGITKYQYNPYTELLETVTYPDGLKLQNQYDANGNRTQMTGPFGNIVYYTYDTLNQMKTVGTSPSTQAADAAYSYYKNGLQRQTQLANGVGVNQYYDGLNLTGVSQTLGTEIANQYNYIYDPNRNITSRTENGTPLTFTYDRLNRITATPELSESYTYDKRGNRLTMNSLDTSAFKLRNNTFDKQNRLTDVAVDGKTVHYRYNGDGLLVERTEDGETTRYYYDGDQIIAEANVVNGIPKPKANYIRGQKLEAIEYANGSKAYVQTNGHGDITELRDNSGNILNQYQYDIWGKILSKEEQVHNPFRYSGELWDDTTELQYLRARWYDPAMARFFSEDPYEGQITNPLSLNLYTYVQNNPLIYTDPTGRCIAGDEVCESLYYFDKDNIRRITVTDEVDYNFYANWYTTRPSSFYKASSRGNQAYKSAMTDVVLRWDREHIDDIILGVSILEGFSGIKVSGFGKTKVSSSTKENGKSLNLSGCNCFTAGTNVLTDEGEKPIEDIEVGDKVLAKDENNPDGELAYKEVTQLFRNQRDDIIKLHVGEQVIETTDNHPFWVEGKDWVFADELQAGDKLQKADGSNLTIDKVEFVKLDEPVTVYNFMVADYHTYYVTDIGIWVHNTNCFDTKLVANSLSGKLGGKAVEASGTGWKVTNITNPLSKNQPIMVRVMNAGSGGRNKAYFRVSVGNKGALTLDGKLSNDMAKTHIDLSDNYMDQIQKMIDNYVKSGGK